MTEASRPAWRACLRPSGRLSALKRPARDQAEEHISHLLCGGGKHDWNPCPQRPESSRGTLGMSFRRVKAASSRAPKSVCGGVPREEAISPRRDSEQGWEGRRPALPAPSACPSAQLEGAWLHLCGAGESNPDVSSGDRDWAMFSAAGKGRV